MIKRLVCLFLAVFMITLTGCNIIPQQESRNIVPGSVIDSDFSLNYNALKITGRLVVQKGGQYSVTVNTPESLSGLQAVRQSDNPEAITVTFMGITQEININSLPKTAFIPVMFGSLKAIFDDEGLSFEESESGYVVEGQSEYGRFVLTLDAERNIRSLIIKEKSFNLTIKDG